MNRFLSSSTIAAAMIFSGSAFAAEDDCLKLMVNYDGAVAESATGAAEQKIEDATSMFRSVMKSAEKAKLCYAVKIAASTDETEISGLRAGAAEAARIFRLAQGQFEKTLDDISAESLSEVAPAAGGDAIMGMGDDIAVSAMEQLFDSYMVLEKSQEIDAALGKLKAG